MNGQSWLKTKKKKKETRDKDRKYFKSMYINIDMSFAV